jgi:membrane-associated phospholipid phosphatase
VTSGPSVGRVVAVAEVASGMTLGRTPPPRRADRPVVPARLPGPAVALVVGAASAVAVVVSAWLATRPGAEQAQAATVLWFNHPPQPLAALLAVVNPLLQPVALAVLAVVLAGWVLRSVPRWARLECLRALGASLLVAELVAQILKRIVDQPRPTAVLPGLDVHGYPHDPWGRAYPSAHTALTVAAVSALWPWMSRWQRAVGLALAVLVPLNRVYIGAHWPIDLVGGAAVGLFATSVCWLVAARWPIGRGPVAGQGVSLDQAGSD